MTLNLVLIILWLGYTIIFFRLYHKFFRVYYFGSAIKGIVKELVICIFLAAFFTLITMWLWWLAAIILVIITLWMRGKCENPSMKMGLTILMGILIVLVAIAGMQLNKSVETSDEIKESESITDTGIFNTTEEQEAYLAEQEAQQMAEEEYLRSSARHAIYCNENDPIEPFEKILTKKQVVDAYGESEDIEDFYMGIYTEVYFRDLLGEYEIDYDVNGIITDANWSCETTDIDYCTEIINDLISYYGEKYGEYDKSVMEEDNLTLYTWETGPGILIKIKNNSIWFNASIYRIDFYGEKLEFSNVECYKRNDGFLIAPHVGFGPCSIEFGDGAVFSSYIKNCMLGDVDLIYYDGSSDYTSNSREYPGLILELKTQDNGKTAVVRQTGIIPDYPDIDLSGEYILYNFEVDKNTEEEEEFDNVWEEEFDNVWEEEFDNVWEEETNNNGYILVNSDCEYLGLEDLEGLSEEECKIARNEIYARYGRLFSDESLQAYFDSCDWYEGTISPDDFDENMLTDIEKANRDLIIEYEKEMGYRD